MALPAAAAQSAPAARQLYGMWYAYPAGNPNTDSIRHEFRHNAATGQDDMIVARVCEGDNHTVTARAVSPIEVTESTIRVLKSASDTETAEGGSVCRASIEAGILSYTISDDGNRLSIANPGGNPDLLELSRQNTVAETALPANLYGSWLLPAQEGKDARVQVRFVFYNSADTNKGTLREITSCSKGNDSLLSQVDSAISVTKDQITILDSVSHEEGNGPFTCTATIAAETLHYVVSSNGVTMTLSKPGQKPVVLIRER